MQSAAWPEPIPEPLAPDDPREIGRYRILGRLGAGGMGRVYLGATRSGRRVAVKVVRPEFADDTEFRRRFEQEVLAARRVQSIYTAAVIDADLRGPRPWVATAHIPGPSLAQAVARAGPLAADTARALVAEIAEALQEIHRAGIVHRDLKPSNVLLAPDGVRVIDFGIARAADSTPLTRTGLRVGTPQFMSPEQALGQRAQAASDVFSLGSLTYFAATARTPFGDGPDTTVLYRIVHEEPEIGGCPESLRPLVQACLAKDPGGRPSVSQIIDTLVGEAAATARGVPRRWENRLAFQRDEATSTRSLPRWRRPAIVVGSVVVAALIIGLLALAVRPKGSGPEAQEARSSGPRALVPGKYQINRRIYRGESWDVTLKSFEAVGNALVARVAYQNISGADSQLSCGGLDVATSNSISLADGQVIASTETYCSKHPGQTWTVRNGETFLSYAIFPAPRDVSKPFSLDWQPGADISGTVSGILIR